ncbi:translocation/assembly module TamB domain-containing protein [Prosthecomicrobium pneumaticum]|uniref:Translocation and assembly module TamB n=1 Tax=Prosthecomicrobium pneumaticum TaxID=81895 RepID=A0A7W9CV97_9HYPH|nr:translocation/assembly module TamB domain-containing protein [Prosthecomicrobium pneumaticum]MBB5752223.1 translocation and assembly module TamB [Prosthecomicrobium pneumaticum]
MRILRRLLLSLIALLLGVAVLAALLFGAAQTGPGKRALAALAGRLASSEGLTVTVEGLSGFVPSEIGVERIVLSDGAGRFATIEGASLVWDPLALLSGTVAIERLAAARVAIDRRPVLPDAQPDGGAGLPLLELALERLSVDEIALAGPVAGLASRFALTGSARLADPDAGLAVDFALTRLDAPGTISGRLGYSPGTAGGRLSVDVTGTEPADGLVANLLEIEGRPPLSLTIEGTAPLDDWNGTLALDAGPAGTVSGTGAVRRVEGGRRVMLDLAGAVEGLVPAKVAPLFAGRTTLMGSAVVRDGGAVGIEGLNLSAPGFGLALVGAIDRSADSLDLTLDLVGGDPARYAALAPGLAWREWRLNATVTGRLSAPEASATFTARDVAGEGYGAAAIEARASATPRDEGGHAFRLDGTATGLTADDPEVAAALGSNGAFGAAGTYVDGVPTVTAAEARLDPLDASFAGTAGAAGLDGRLDVTRLDLAAFSALAGRPLSGTAALRATVAASAGFADLRATVEGRGDHVATGIAALDGMLAGRSVVRGGVARSADGIAVDGLTLSADGLDVSVDGRIDRTTADLSGRAALADLGRFDPRVSGAADATFRFSGALGSLALDARLAVPSGVAMGKPVENLALEATLADLTGRPSGTLALTGSVAGKPARGRATLATDADGGRTLDGLDLAVGSVTAQGTAALGADGLLRGRLAVAAGDLADLAPLVLADIGGRLDATVTLDAADGRQTIALEGTGAGLTFGDNRAGRAEISATVTDPAGALRLDGRAVLGDVAAGGRRIERATVTASGDGSATALTLDTAIEGATVQAAGQLALAGETRRLRLDRLDIARSGVTAALGAPATLTFGADGVAIDALALRTGSGRATVRGRAGETLDLSVEIADLPLSLAALADPGLDLDGALSGEAQISGRADRLEGRYRLTVPRLTNGRIARAGLGPFAIRAEGTLAGGRATVDATIDAPSVSGVRVEGSVPLGAGDLDLALAGTIDLAIANTALANSGARVAGTTAIDARIGGSAAAPRLSGTARVSGGRYDDTLNGIALSDIAATLTGSDRTVEIAALTARTPQGGTVTGSGRIGLDPAAGFPADITLTLSRATLLSSDLVRLVTGGRVTISGPIAQRPRIGGRLDISSLDVNLPERLPGGLDPLDVRHINIGRAPGAERGLRARAREEQARRRRADAAPPAFLADLDLTLSAPNGVFVRGMGMDAEFGGDLTLSGTTASPVTLGAFELRRGRLEILGRRLDFTRGNVGFTGSLDPTLDIAADTTSDNVTVTVEVTGTASTPEVSFTSSPELAQDEVLSRLLFDRSIGSLTPGQALQVAQTIAQFSGGGPGVVDDVRRSLGVDTLDIGTDPTGTGAEVGIGKRLNDRVYLGVRQGTKPDSSRVTVDVDVTRNIRLQGATGADGDSEIGIGAQWDY